MDDLTITKLCAEAMELDVVEQLGEWHTPNTQFEDSLYDPLHDDAQAFALLVSLHSKGSISISKQWLTLWLGGDHQNEIQVPIGNGNLRRAICVATLQASKRGG